MTRVNVIEPSKLTREHLVAEYRELPRVFKQAAYFWAYGGRRETLPTTYRLGAGHVRFFYDKLEWVAQRHAALVAEMQRRGYTTNLEAVDQVWRGLSPAHAWGDWTPPPSARMLNLRRLVERSPGGAYNAFT
jgi:deoxyribonuclease (pyrimidine dimer)